MRRTLSLLLSPRLLLSSTTCTVACPTNEERTLFIDSKFFAYQTFRLHRASLTRVSRNLICRRRSTHDRQNFLYNLDGSYTKVVYQVYTMRTAAIRFTWLRARLCLFREIFSSVPSETQHYGATARSQHGAVGAGRQTSEKLYRNSLSFPECHHQVTTTCMRTLSCTTGVFHLSVFRNSNLSNTAKIV